MKISISTYISIAVVCLALCIFLIAKNNNVIETEETTTAVSVTEETEPVVLAVETVNVTEVVLAQVSTVSETETETETETEPAWEPYNIPLDYEFQREIKAFCDWQEFDYDLLLAVMYVETRWEWKNGDYRDGKYNAIGYMQIWPLYWSDYAAENGFNLYEPLGNVECGVFILKRAIKAENGDVRRALQSYNTGNPDTNNGYADLVFEAYEMIGGLYGQH